MFMPKEIKHEREIKAVLDHQSVNLARPDFLQYLWPNLKNLSGGLNLSRGLNMVGFT